MTPLPASTNFPVPDLDDQQIWRACIGLDLADRTVLEAEVLIWHIVQQRRLNLALASAGGATSHEPVSRDGRKIERDIATHR